MSLTDPAQSEAAKAASTCVKDGQIVGLGSGTTAALFIRHLAERIQSEGLKIVGVATSESTAELADSLGIKLAGLDDVDELDVDVDGADEVDPNFQMVKGRGGALLREKIVAAAAKRRIIVVTKAKRVEMLGQHFPIPVEASTFGLRHTQRALEKLGATPVVRTNADAGVVVTDGGNNIIDCRFKGVEDPLALDRRLKQIAGVLETGIFINLCDCLVVGHQHGVEILEKPGGS